MKYLKPYNESVRDHLKPKSKDEIMKLIKNFSKERKFLDGCEYGLTSLVKDMLDMGVDPSINEDHGLSDAVEKNHKDIVEILLKDSRVDPSRYDNLLICQVSLHYQKNDILRLLLKHPKVDPSCRNNFPIKKAAEYRNDEAVKLLLNDERVKSKLKKWELERYTELASYVTESVKDYLKPKSEEEIMKSMIRLPLLQKFLMGCQYGFLPIVKNAIDEGLRPDWNYNIGLRKATNYGQLDTVKYLLFFDGVNPFQIPIDRGRCAFNIALDLIGTSYINDKKPYFDILKLFASDDILNRFVIDDEDKRYYKKMAKEGWIV